MAASSSQDQLFNLWPNQQLGLHHLEASHVDSLSFRALGFQPTGAIVPHPIATGPLMSPELGSSTPRQPASVAGTAGGEGGKGDNEVGGRARAGRMLYHPLSCCAVL